MGELKILFRKASLFFFASLVSGASVLLILIALALLMMGGLGHGPGNRENEAFFKVMWTFCLVLVPLSLFAMRVLRAKEEPDLNGKRQSLQLAYILGGIGWPLIYFWLWPLGAAIVFGR